MSRSPELYPWRTEIAKHFPHLSQPMVMGLALWSLGMILVRSCSLTATADGLPVPGSPRQQGRCWRLVGVFRYGWSLIVAALFNHQPLPLGHGCPEPWPTPSMSPDILSLPMLEDET